MILDEIVAYKRRELMARKEAVPPAELERQARGRPAPLALAAALRGEGVGLIAEIKRASPSRGVLCPNLDALGLAEVYAANGASAISVLTEVRFFQGSPDWLRQIRQALGPGIPLLRKDFILDPYQVLETYALGADALLLIAAVLSDGAMAELLAMSQELGMTALIEVHDEREVERALRLSPDLVGINNRSLKDFRVDLATFARLRPLLPREVVVVAESGVHSAADVGRLASMGADAVLVGEALVTAEDVAAKVRELVMGGRA